jgi:hypothetical protein
MANYIKKENYETCSKCKGKNLTVFSRDKKYTCLDCKHVGSIYEWYRVR